MLPSPDIDAHRLSGSALSLQGGGSQEIFDRIDTHSIRSGADFDIVSMNSENVPTTEGFKYCKAIYDYKVSSAVVKAMMS